MIERWVIGHFEADLQRQLEEHEKARLRACLENFIADDKSNESVELSFADDPATIFQFGQRTTPNGVSEESVRISDKLVRELYAHQVDGARW